MELIDGDTLKDRWPALSEADKLSIFDQLRQMMLSLRTIEQEASNQFIGIIEAA
jgi:hypothetical protein